MNVNPPNNLKMNQIMILEENGIDKFKDFSYLRKDFESMTFLHLPTRKKVILRR